MPGPITAIAGAAVIAASGYGIGTVVLGSGGTSHAAAAKVPALSADPTGRPYHDGYTYAPPPGTQNGMPGLAPVQGQARGGGPPPAGGGYVPHGQLSAPLGRAPGASQQGQPTTWPLYLSGSDLLQPDGGAASGTDQSVGSSLSGPCGPPGNDGHWTGPATSEISLHGPMPGVLHIVASGAYTLQISFVTFVYGGSCQVLTSTTASGSGNRAVSFTLPRFDADVHEGVNLSLVVSATPTVRVESSYNAPSYIVAPTTPH